MVMFNEEEYGDVKSNLWILIHVPGSDFEFEYEIIPNSNYDKIPFEALKRGNQMTLYFNKASTTCYIVGIGGSWKILMENFETLKSDYLNNTDLSANLNLFPVDQQNESPRVPIIEDENKENVPPSLKMEVVDQKNDCPRVPVINHENEDSLKREAEKDPSGLPEIHPIENERRLRETGKLAVTFQAAATNMLTRCVEENNKDRADLQRIMKLSGERPQMENPQLQTFIAHCEEKLKMYEEEALRLAKLQNRKKNLEAWRSLERSSMFRENLHLPIDMYFLQKGGDGCNPSVTIGKNKTPIKLRDFKTIPWNGPCSAITRALLMMVFTREELATLTLSGKASPAFPKYDWETKGALDQSKVDDIVEIIYAKTRYSKKQIRAAITTKCADENKMLKDRLKKQLEEIEDDQEHGMEVDENEDNL